VCTVTIVPVRNGFRLGCNRDERRDRVAALPPAVHGLSHRTAIFPVDPAGPGTWVGINDASLAAALLNRSADSTAPHHKSRRRSRGLIIPYLLACDSLADAVHRGAAVDPRDFDRFRLAIVQRGTVATLTSDGAELAVEVTELARPMMLTSSSLGDALVERPRRRLFERVFAGGERTWVQAQSLFHRHQWRSRRDISVRMARADATTVSQTFVIVMGSAIDEFRSWLDRHGGWAIVASRFLPGSRLPLYVIAGIVELPGIVFAGWALLGTLLWTPALVLLTAIIGEAFIGRISSLIGSAWMSEAVAAVVLMLILRSMRATRSQGTDLADASGM
jgi:transport and Golgi organization protein 2